MELGHNQLELLLMVVQQDRSQQHFLNFGIMQDIVITGLTQTVNVDGRVPTLKQHAK